MCFCSKLPEFTRQPLSIVVGAGTVQGRNIPHTDGIIAINLCALEVILREYSHYVSFNDCCIVSIYLTVKGFRNIDSRPVKVMECL